MENESNLFTRLHFDAVKIGYADHTIEIFDAVIRKLLSISSQPDSQTVKCLEEKLNQSNLASNTIRSYLGVLRKIKRYIANSFLDPPRKKYLVNTSYNKLTVHQFKSIIDNFIDALRCSHLTEHSIQTYANSAITFFTFLQEQGINSLCEVKENHLLDFFCNEKRGHSVMYSLKRFCMLYLERTSDVSLELIHNYIPRIPIRKKNYDYLLHDESVAIRNILVDPNAQLTLRDRAIGTIAYYLGLRTSDICNLKLTDIKWETDSICIVQSKTLRQLSLPLTTNVGNAIYDYIHKERPNSDYPNVFLTTGKWNTPLSRMALYSISVKIFRAAGLRLNDGRKGLHIFRHNFCTSMLSKNVESAVISQCVGHHSPETLKHYVDSDTLHLKECSRSIACYPLNQNRYNI